MKPNIFKTFKISGNKFHFSTYTQSKLDLYLKTIDGGILYHEMMNCNPNATYYVQHNGIINKSFLLEINGEQFPIVRDFERISQISISPGLYDFVHGLKNRWGLVDYYDMDAPCLFFGCFEQQSKINNHNGYKILVFSTDNNHKWFHGNAQYNQQKITNYDKLIVSDSPTFKSPDGVRTKFISDQGIGFEIKDYSKYTPNVLGDKIYYYLHSHDRKKEFFYDTIERISKKVPFEFIYGIKDKEFKGFHPHEYMIEIYKQCFLNINLSSGTGLTTVIEMAKMGIKTLANKDRNLCQSWECMINCDINNDDEIIKLIMEESKKIGATQPSINVHNVDEEWLDINFWIN
jgi:hypothetical protein